MQKDVPLKINLNRKNILKAEKANSTDTPFSKSYSLPSTRKHGKFSSRSNAVITQNLEQNDLVDGNEDLNQMENYNKKEGQHKVFKSNASKYGGSIPSSRLLEVNISI